MSKPGFTSKQLREMSDEQLAEHWSGWRPQTGDWFLCEMEVKRRQTAASEFRGWASVVLSVLAFIVSLYALYAKSAP
jgi:hypothetical protein